MHLEFFDFQCHEIKIRSLCTIFERHGKKIHCRNRVHVIVETALARYTLLGVFFSLRILLWNTKNFFCYPWTLSLYLTFQWLVVTVKLHVILPANTVVDWSLILEESFSCIALLLSVGILFINTFFEKKNLQKNNCRPGTHVSAFSLGNFFLRNTKKFSLFLNRFLILDILATGSNWKDARDNTGENSLTLKFGFLRYL